MQPRIIFFTIASAVLLGISWFTTSMYTKAFRLSSTISIISVLAFLLVPILFVVSIVLSRGTPAMLSPLVYTTIQIIAGIGFYVFVSAILLGIALAVAALAHFTLPFWVPILTLTLALSASILGLIQSRYITTTPYSVTLINAPESWDNRTAVLVSDTHFGLTNYTKFSDKVISKIISLRPDFVLHAGDFYDGPFVDTVPMTTSWEKLASQIPVFYAPGNHEIYGDYQAFVASIRDAGVTVLDDKVTTYDGIQIAGITYRDGKDDIRAADAIKSLSLNPTVPSILINHPPTSLAAAESAGVDLMVSGHTHNGQFWPMTYLVRRIYGIYYYGHKAYKDMQTITSSGVGTWGPPFRLFNPPELVVITFKTK